MVREVNALDIIIIIIANGSMIPMLTWHQLPMVLLCANLNFKHIWTSKDTAAVDSITFYANDGSFDRDAASSGSRFLKIDY